MSSDLLHPPFSSWWGLSRPTACCAGVGGPLCEITNGKAFRALNLKENVSSHLAAHPGLMSPNCANHHWSYPFLLRPPHIAFPCYTLSHTHTSTPTDSSEWLTLECARTQETYLVKQSWNQQGLQNKSVWRLGSKSVVLRLSWDIPVQTGKMLPVPLGLYWGVMSSWNRMNRSRQTLHTDGLTHCNLMQTYKANQTLLLRLLFNS